MNDDLEGFGEEHASDAELDTRALVKQQNRKKKKSGGFQSMGLSYNVYRGILKSGYKVPTPIQRKVSPTLDQFSSWFTTTPIRLVVWIPEGKIRLLCRCTLF